MRRRPMAPAASLGRINVTPMIDVIMCLIVFYLIVGKLAGDRRAEMDLPPSQAGAPDAPPDAIFVNIAPGPAAPMYLVDRQVVPAALLDEAIGEQLRRRPQATLHVRADRSLAYGVVEPVIEAARRAGAPSVRLATQREGAR
ncbi:MAG: ExbD/TolR family protein [Phycisphaerales bacterium JB039]